MQIDDTVIANMRLRVERCRRLASGCTDLEVARTLNQMADEGEADIARLMADRAAEGSPGETF